jgi:putative DNA primase/helicase
VSTTSPRPTPLPVRVEGIPEAMREERRWVGWHLQPRKDKWTKVPCIATSPSYEAKSTDPTTWRAFNEALAAYEDGKCDGVGFVLGDDWSGFDADGTDAPE